MHATTTLNHSTNTAQAMAREATPRRPRATDELYEFRRYNYADGWDSDDAALGWVDDEIVQSGTRRRLH